MWNRLYKNRKKHMNFAVACREYSHVGQVWPRLMISLYTIGNPFNVPGYTISISYKSGPGEWWQDKYPLPFELVQEFKEMIDEAEEVRNAK